MPRVAGKSSRWQLTVLGSRRNLSAQKGSLCLLEQSFPKKGWLVQQQSTSLQKSCPQMFVFRQGAAVVPLPGGTDPNEEVMPLMGCFSGA